MDAFKKKVIRTTSTVDTPLAVAPDVFAAKPKTPTVLPEVPYNPLKPYGGTTEEQINELQKQGIDVFDPKVLRNFSAQDQAAQAMKNAVEARATAAGQMINEAQRPEIPVQGGLDWAGAAKEAIAQGASHAAAGAAAGAILAPATLGTSIPLGAAAGFVEGTLSKLYGELTAEARTDIIGEYKGFTDSVTNVKSILNSVNKGGDPYDAIQLYQIEMSKIDAAERKLKMLSEKDWIHTSKKQLIAIEDFNRYQRDKLRMDLINAIAMPDPTKTYDIPIENVAEVEA